MLGAEGYRTILGRMRTENIPLPVVAIGGIELPDIPQIMRTGVDGIALSGAIARADSPATTTANFLNAIRNA